MARVGLACLGFAWPPSRKPGQARPSQKPSHTKGKRAKPGWPGHSSQAKPSRANANTENRHDQRDQPRGASTSTGSRAGASSPCSIHKRLLSAASLSAIGCLLDSGGRGCAGTSSDVPKNEHVRTASSCRARPLGHQIWPDRRTWRTSPKRLSSKLKRRQGTCVKRLFLSVPCGLHPAGR